MSSDSRNEDRPTSLKWIISEILSSLDAGKAYHAQKAAEYGVARDVFAGFQVLSSKMPEGALEQSRPAFEKFRLFVQAEEKQRSRFDPSSGAIAMTGVSTLVACTSGMTLSEVTDFVESYIRPPKFWNPERSAQYAKRLETLDPELGSLYRGISDSFWGYVENAERSAFALARQCFDQLFSVLAPDDVQIRQSKFFEQKVGDKPLAVSRVERVRFAAANRVKDKAQADFLAEQAAEMVDAYNDLQKLRARGPLERHHARAILQTFIAAIDQWVDALDL